MRAHTHASNKMKQPKRRLCLAPALIISPADRRVLMCLVSWMQRPASCCQLTPNQSFIPFFRLLEQTPRAGPFPVQPSRTAFQDAKDTEIFLDRVDHLVLPTLSSSSDNPDLTFTNYTLHSSTYVHSDVCPHADSFTPPHKAPAPCQVLCWVFRLERKSTYSLIEAHTYYFKILFI